MKSAAWALVVFFFLAGCAAAPVQASVATPAAQTYIQNKGSDTMVNLALAWAEQYQTLKPDVRLSVTGGGTGTGITSLLNGTVDIANASRAMKDEERTTALAAGIDPVEFVVARDAIAVIVNPENPVQELTLQQISAIYRGEINNWLDVGGEDRPIVRLSRETNSGTHVYFLETVIRLGSKTDKSIFAADTLLLPSSEGIISEVSDNPNAIGYDGLGYITTHVKVLAVAANPGEAYVMPSAATVNSGTYPVARDLFMYTAGEPQGEIRDYIDWILADAGQAIVSNLGFVPVGGKQP
jgi:phosphate transport system substrate-binding protein